MKTQPLVSNRPHTGVEARAWPTRLVLLIGPSALAGCMSLSGLNAAPRYGCKAPEGITCRSVSGVYANRDLRAAPTQGPSAFTSVPPALQAPAAAALPPPTPGDGLLRSSPRILRLWVKPWEDVDGDLVDQSHVYVQVDGGQWLIDHAQRRIREAHAPLRPPSAPAAAAGAVDRDPARNAPGLAETMRPSFAQAPMRPSAGATAALPGAQPLPAWVAPIRSTASPLHTPLPLAPAAEKD
jgi:conjugal transfer pilus assembly protein TraV